MTSLLQKKSLVTDFLVRCNDYADRQIARYRTESAGAGPARELELQDKIGHWCAYRAFNLHAIEELRGNELDDWFD